MNRTYNSTLLRTVRKITRTFDVTLSQILLLAFRQNEDDHNRTVEMILNIGYDGAFMFIILRVKIPKRMKWAMMFRWKLKRNGSINYQITNEISTQK